MPAHGDPLVAVELAGLVEHGVADAQLADVVQQRAAAQPAAARVRQAEPARDLVDDVGDARAVAARERALAVDDLAEGRGDVVEVVVVERDRAGRPAPSRTPRARRRRSERAPEAGIGARRWSIAATSAGSNQLPARPRASASAAAGPPTRVEHVDHLRQQRDARIQRDRLAGQAFGPAAAVPVLVEAGDAVGDAVAEAQPPRDVGAARAARPDQLVGDLGPLRRMLTTLRRRSARPAFRPVCVKTKRSTSRQAVADRLEVALEAQGRRSGTARRCARRCCCSRGP